MHSNLENQEITQLQNSLINANVEIAEMSEKLKNRDDDITRLKQILESLKINNPFVIKEEVIGAYACLKNKLENTGALLRQVRSTGGPLRVGFFIESNDMMLAGLNTLMSLSEVETQQEIANDSEETT